MSTQILLTAVEYGKPQSKYCAKASAGNAALAFDQEYQRKLCYQNTGPMGFCPVITNPPQTGGGKKDLSFVLQHANLQSLFFFFFIVAF